MREVVLLDVTAMAGDAVCVAGVERTTGKQLRLNEPQPTRMMVRRLGGLAPGDVISIDWKGARRPDPPHTEDGEWKLRSLKRVGRLDHAALTDLLAGSAFNSLSEAFGEAAFRGRNGNSAWPVHKGTRSLATVAVRYVRVGEDRAGRVRIAFKDASGAYWSGVPPPGSRGEDTPGRVRRLREGVPRPGGGGVHRQPKFDPRWAHAAVRAGGPRDGVLAAGHEHLRAATRALLTASATMWRRARPARILPPCASKPSTTRP